MSKAWKDAERQVAKALGGTRRIRVTYSESCEDVIHPTLGIEVKYGRQVPVSSMVTQPTMTREFVLVPFRYLHFLITGAQIDAFVEGSVKGRGFILKGLKQARNYNSDKLPVLCLKRPRCRGFVAVMFRSDFVKLRVRPIAL